jgi:hypothetical protein
MGIFSGFFWGSLRSSGTQGVATKTTHRQGLGDRPDRSDSSRSQGPPLGFFVIFRVTPCPDHSDPAAAPGGVRGVNHPPRSRYDYPNDRGTTIGRDATRGGSGDFTELLIGTKWPFGKMSRPSETQAVRGFHRGPFP